MALTQEGKGDHGTEDYEEILRNVKEYLKSLNASTFTSHIRQQEKKFSVINDALMRWMRGGLRVVPIISDRAEVLRAMHDDIGHW